MGNSGGAGEQNFFVRNSLKQQKKWARKNLVFVDFRFRRPVEFPCRVGYLK